MFGVAWWKYHKIKGIGKNELKRKLIKYCEKRIKSWEEIAGISRDYEPDCVILELTTLMTELDNWQEKWNKKKK